MGQFSVVIIIFDNVLGWPNLYYYRYKMYDSFGIITREIKNITDACVGFVTKCLINNKRVILSVFLCAVLIKKHIVLSIHMHRLINLCNSFIDWRTNEMHSFGVYYFIKRPI